MIPCPSCQQPVEILDKHMGTLFTCPHCNAVYFIDWSGQPEIAQHEPEPQEANQDFSAPVDVYSSTDYSLPASEDPSQGSLEQSESGFEPSEQIFATEAYEPEPPSMEQPSSDFSIQPDEAPYDFSQTLDAVNVAPVVESSSMDSPDFSDVTDFANATQTVGPLTYIVTIEGIESSMLLNQLREAMTDSRFGWDVTELFSQIGAGQLVLRGLSPAKASVLINRIKYLPFKISWRQDVLGGS